MTTMSKLTRMLAVVLFGVITSNVLGQSLNLTITAPEQGIPAGPVCYEPAEKLDPWESYCLIGHELCIPTQVDKDGKVWWWQKDAVEAGRTLKFELTVMGSGTIAIDGGLPIAVKKLGKDEVEVKADRKPFARFVYKEDEVRPYLYPVIGPTGDPVTRDYPMKDTEIEKANGRQDHHHHRSIWSAHGKITTPDLGERVCNFWHEPKDKPIAECDRQVVKRIRRVVSGPVFGLIEAEILWIPGGMDEPIFTERRTYTFFAGHKTRIIDVSSRFEFENSDVTFGDDKEGGLLSLRTAVTMDEQGVKEPKQMRGQMTNSEGQVGHDECWGKPARWCDYVGPVGQEGEVVGIAVMDHPENFRHPTRWHIRNYGLYTANPFGLSQFTQKEDKQLEGTHTFKKGSEQEFNYRVLIHKGDTREARITEQWELYAKSLSIKAE